MQKEIKYLTCLKILILNNNKLIGLPNEIRYLTCLKELNLLNNDLPDDIAQMSVDGVITYFKYLDIDEVSIFSQRFVLFGEQKKG